MPRRTAPRVRDGRVEKKNNWRPSRGNYRALRQDEIVLDRRKPADGHRHLVTTTRLRTFLSMLPDWDEVAIGLRAIVLDSDTDSYGWYRAGVVAICNWERELWTVEPPSFLEQCGQMLDLLDVETVPLENSFFVAEANELLEEYGKPPIGRDSPWREIRWTERQARAFQLLYVLPHELGHHHDRMTTQSRRRVARGEPYAEAYARRTLDRLWPSYARQLDD
jgi:hypothetical protein